MKKCSKGPSLSDSTFYNDPYLLSFAGVIRSRIDAAHHLKQQIEEYKPGGLYSFADYHDIFGLHFDGHHWVMCEWAPNASKIFVLCDKNGWQKHDAYRLEKKENGVFETVFPGQIFSHGDLFRLKVVWDGGEGDRIPTAATRVVQDTETLMFNAQVWHPEQPYLWKIPEPEFSDESLLIYEAHVGMALEEMRVGTYVEFERHILPKIKHAGYNAIQLMAVQEHPYYGSFGYHVSSFFAPSSRFGTPEELKSLIDTAHEMGIRVLMDIIHSHCVRNEVEGLSRFDGTLYQFFHDGPRGTHRLWDSRCFDYSKLHVIKFLLSNLKYWMEEFKIDGFRFDGITSMLFEDHGLGRAFTCYNDYFGPDVDVSALAYLTLANDLAHNMNAQLITIAEDVSGYPGLAAPISQGGIGFDFRFAMGIADFWIKLLKEVKDEDWPMGKLWYELTTRREEEKTISYAECHDQALVGDKTLMMHLMGSHIYTAMNRHSDRFETFRGVALHKMIRLITISTANAGYLNFIGNEFGHPEWVDFPSKQNGFSYQYARRQWSLKYNPDLYYYCLFEFDRHMIHLVKDQDLFSVPFCRLLHLHDDDKVIAFERNQLIFVFNFHPTCSYSDYMFDVPPGKYQMILDTDEKRFGGHERLQASQIHYTLHDPLLYGQDNRLSLYLPARTAIVLALGTDPA
ncbi:MAG: alpha amylase C-terminal domain-containing protein [Proteobacteria bacterium]|nr:alpha amylase C-terminal domain-containing protein [Pseudomonadota bacterium]MBU1390097.1 alpha amylase C-terminal domain-containing protein [Pseudomonadota bacterium]MBU1544952.1 alpha amylase C-terminal domain-containing protein [Pseudomonadota bacterium]MBU2482288.1 alpha amylase C-terminal domain-containing protein [Pseudomonadota bacterium]